MSRYPIITLALTLSILAGSCYTSQLSLDVLEPAINILPSSIQRLSVLPLPGAPSAQFDSLALLWLESGTDIYEVKMGYLYGINDVLSNSPRLQRVILSDTSGTKYKKTGRLFWDELRQVCTNDTTDIVLVLTRAVSRDFYPAGINKSSNVAVTLVDYSIINKTRWIFYEPKNEQIITRFEFADTIKISGDLVSLEVPAILYEACYLTGQRTGKRLTPYWQTVSRVIYSGPGKDLKDAAEFAVKNHWYKASLIWNELIEHRNIKIASRAAFNLALAFEQDDELDQANLWISYADSISSNKQTLTYSKILSTRLKNKTFLEEQLTGH